MAKWTFGVKISDYFAVADLLALKFKVNFLLISI